MKTAKALAEFVWSCFRRSQVRFTLALWLHVQADRLHTLADRVRLG